MPIVYSTGGRLQPPAVNSGEGKVSKTFPDVAASTGVGCSAINVQSASNARAMKSKSIVIDFRRTFLSSIVDVTQRLFIRALSGPSIAVDHGAWRRISERGACEDGTGGLDITTASGDVRGSV